MKTLKEIRNFDHRVGEVCSSIRYFLMNDIDWDVYLPTLGKNLQRDYVWTLKQKRELIWSILMDRHIPHCAILNIVNPQDPKKDIWQIIDGKQRLSTLADFYKARFTLEIEGQEYLLSELPEEYQLHIKSFTFRYYVLNEPWGKPLTDQEKVSWFRFINFAGTPQDEAHLNSLANVKATT